jgi:hypothetical protein
MIIGISQLTVGLWFLAVSPVERAVRQDLTVAKAIALLDGATQAIRSFDVQVTTSTKILIRHEASEHGTGLPITRSRKLDPNEQPTIDVVHCRQRYQNGKSRVESLDGPNGRAATIVVSNSEVEKMWDPGRSQGAIRPPAVTSVGEGGDYLESLRGVYGRVSILQILRQRPAATSLTIAATPGHVTLEAKPYPDAAVDFPNWGFRITLDATRGFMPVVVERYELINDRPQVAARRTVTRIKELPGRIWVPITVVTEKFDTNPKSSTFGELGNEVVMSIDESTSSWNRAIPASVFQVEYPPGTRLNDAFRKVQYVTGKPDPGSNLQDLAANARDIVPANTSMVWNESKDVGYRWLIAVGAGMFAAGAMGALLFIRRRRLEHDS